ncbi:MAG: RNA 2',3'-cyclic phosphodiesterase [Candidatus Omnitrophica bacterium]|nr:RNA 2',3'-cyclic phosphodiesterase [Candidatus Omnitrophota bacterium]
MRAFIGIPLPPDVRSSLSRLQRELAASGADVKWVRPAQVHVTLKFLGEISEGERHAIEALVARVAASETPFAIRLNAFGAFPSLTAPRVVWVGVGEGGEAVARLTEAIEREGVAIPLRKEERAFSPHITLGRVRSPRGRQALVAALRDARWDPPPPPWRVSSVTLYQSVLRPEGPQHTVLAEFPLLERRAG